MPSKFIESLLSRDNALQSRYFERLEQFSGVALSTYSASSPQVEWIIGSLKNCRYEGEARSLFIEAKLYELLAIAIDENARTREAAASRRMNKKDLGQFQQIKQYLEANFLKDFSLRSLAREFALNECKLKTGFKALFGKTIFGYVQELRMEYARNLMTESDKTVYQVADVLGYKNAHHFSTAFKKYFGCSPGQLQRRQKLA